MAIERRFLGWNRPALHLAVDFLLDEFARDGQWDMSRVVVALPGARAGRRLRALLAINAATLAGRDTPCLLTPPRIITAGELPEALYAPTTPIATELQSLLAWAGALRRLDRQDHLALFCRAAAIDGPGALGLAAEVAAIEQELAAERVSYDQLSGYCEVNGLAGGAARWRAFEKLAGLYDKELAHSGFASLNQARARALDSKSLAPDITFVLIGTVDLPELTQAMLFESLGRTIALVHAPESEAGGFDEAGCLVSAYWQEAPIPLSACQIEIVDYPPDQARAVAKFAQRLAEIPDDFLSVGLGDETLGPQVERAIDLFGRKARRATGTRLAASAPARLLAALSAYLSDRGAAEFAALVRHPDINDWLVRALGLTETAGDWPEHCDKHISEHLPITIKPGGKLPDRLDQAVQAICDLAGPDLRERKPLASWSERIGAILAQVYPAEGPVPPALPMLVAALSDLDRIGNEPDSPRTTFTEAIGFLLAICGPWSIAPPPGQGQVEVVGWLESHLDDNPVLILAGVNEGAIPESVRADTFLPDSLRREVGLLDNRRRYARDAYLLSAIVRSRQVVHAICGRFGAQNEPLAPSRLILACEVDEVVRRLLAFYGERDEAALAQPQQQPADTEPFPIPRPHRAAKPLNKLRVTAFRDYLACPYRFYLKHVLGLGTMKDDQIEMGQDAFGDILHKVMQDFGRWVKKELAGRPPDDPGLIAKYLHESLDKRAKERFGEEKHPAVAVQVELLSRRLTAFARFQAAEAHAGWVIQAIEKDIKAEVVVDGVPFTIVGKIDRIDYHPGRGLYRILDYKSRDGGSDPHESHRDGDAWIDLQLPLYRRIAPVIDIPAESVEVGYIALPKDVQKVGWAPAPWDEDEFLDAYCKADEVIKKIRDQEFWPPSPSLPAYDDGLGAICRDSALDRESAILASAGAEAVWIEIDKVATDA